jgi:transposase
LIDVQIWLAIFNYKNKCMKKNYEWFMGIDVSKEKVDVSLLQGSQEQFHIEVENTPSSIEKFIKSLRGDKKFSWDKCLVCMEHTGVYNAHLLGLAEKHGWNLCLESAIQIKQSGGLQRGKNDRVDALRIAQYAYKNIDFIKLWQPSKTTLLMLQKLSALRSRLITAKKMLSNTMKEDKQFLSKEITKELWAGCKHSIAVIENDISRVESKIEEVINNDEELKRLFKVVESVPGIGRVTALQMVITTNEFKNIKDPRKYACYSGVAPFEHSSGTSIRGKTRTSKKANQHVKSMLHMCSLVAVKHNEELKQYYERKVSMGKNKMSVLNAVKNKLIHRVFACVNQNKLYEKNFQKSLLVS